MTDEEFKKELLKQLSGFVDIKDVII